MGFRHYLHLVDNNEIKNLENITKEKLFELKSEKVDDDDYLHFDDIFNKFDLIYEFGKLYNDLPEKINATGRPLFADKLLKELWNDYDTTIIGKEGLLAAIEWYRSAIQTYYKNLLSETDDRILSMVKAGYQNYIREWDDGVDVNLENKYNLHTSWKYEHSIFTLVHILKTVDWEKHSLIFYGH